MNHFLSPTFSPIRTVVEEGSIEAVSTAKPPTIPNTIPRPINLASRGSEDSMSSWASSETDSVVSAGRRQIFSEYWKTNTPPIHDSVQDNIKEEEEEDDKQPRSPLLQHYPSARTTQAGSIHSRSPTSTIHLEMKKANNNTTKLSPRRSIFGDARSNSYNSYSTSDELDLDRFFSKHEHMTVLSSSLDSKTGLSTHSSITTTTCTLLLSQRPRSYSCSDTSAAAARSILRKGPLISCLKRRNSHSTSNDSIAADAVSSSTGEAERRPSVTFDSQIEIVAFEPTSSFNEESSCLNESWNGLFEH